MSKLANQAQLAIARVAPQWPLPQWVAVNPLWEYRQQPLTEVAAQWRYCGNVALTMSPEFYQQHYEQGAIEPALVTDDMRRQLTQLSDTPRWQNISHLVDRYQQRRRKMLWHDEVVFQISQSCGLFMQFPRRFQGQGKDSSLYQHWLTISRADRGIETLMDEADLNELFAELPDSPDALFEACEQLWFGSAPSAAAEHYCQALIIDVLGWASALSYQDRQHGSQWLLELLAIRMAWDYLLWQLADRTNQAVFEPIKQDFEQQLRDSDDAIAAIIAQQQSLWQWQRAYEQSQLSALKFKPAADADRNDSPQLQAVFCIDVRSDRYRRALAQAGREHGMTVNSKGFAGFFGVPLGREQGDQQIPHVPGLLQPSFFVRQQSPDKSFKDLLSRSFNSPASMFTGVEALGLAKLGELLKGIKGSLDIAQFDADAEIYHNGRAVTCEQLAELCAQALTGMQFTQFAEHVVLVGHGAKHSNNAQRAGMNCGACGGQTGALSARVLCHLLNQSAIRQRLSEHGFAIPQATQFYAALHETVTDDIVWLSEDVPAQVKQTFASASAQLQQQQPNRTTRANHWAELRPEWGLAGNQALFFGNAGRLADDAVQGRSFLHDYDEALDADGSLLTALLSAPGLVANWINWQYYTAVTDPQRMGSGNKLLHNRVANDIGVFEGNGGDLRLGLAWQSVHDGSDYVHKPVRLSVIIEASEPRIHKALAQAGDFNQLYQNQWIDVYRLNPRGELCRLQHQ